jgi:hypothetical protein
LGFEHRPELAARCLGADLHGDGLLRAADRRLAALLVLAAQRYAKAPLVASPHDSGGSAAMSDMTPEKVRELLEGASPWPWHNRGDVIAYESGRILINLCEAPERTADAELVAAAPEIAQAYLGRDQQIAAVRALAKTWYETATRMRDRGRDDLLDLYLEGRADDLIAALDGTDA